MDAHRRDAVPSVCVCVCVCELTRGAPLCLKTAAWYLAIFCLVDVDSSTLSNTGGPGDRKWSESREGLPSGAGSSLWSDLRAALRRLMRSCAGSSCQPGRETAAVRKRFREEGRRSLGRETVPVPLSTSTCHRYQRRARTASCQQFSSTHTHTHVHLAALVGAYLFLQPKANKLKTSS